MSAINHRQREARLVTQLRSAESIITAAEQFVDIVSAEPGFRYPFAAKVLKRAITEHHQAAFEQGLADDPGRFAR